jgi:hypothetical protein
MQAFRRAVHMSDVQTDEAKKKEKFLKEKRIKIQRDIFYPRLSPFFNPVANKHTQKYKYNIKIPRLSPFFNPVANKHTQNTRHLTLFLSSSVTRQCTGTL